MEENSNHYATAVRLMLLPYRRDLCHYPPQEPAARPHHLQIREQMTDQRVSRKSFQDWLKLVFI